MYCYYSFLSGHAAYRMENILQVILFDSSERIWIGCNDLQQEGRFVWVHNNQPVVYSHWAPGEPNNSNNDNHCCMIGWYGPAT